MSFIDNLQNKPKKTRVLILWLVSAFVMLIVFIIWFSTFSKNTKDTNIKNESEQNKLPSLFESFKKDISTFKQGLDASVSEIKEQTNSIENEEKTTQ